MKTNICSDSVLDSRLRGNDGWGVAIIDFEIQTLFFGAAIIKVKLPFMGNAS
ncbi:MAG: hypothetical protein K2W99_04205 [Chthoniobacterales bacterium]|nr:hypothetical protein [Chthoniobacterales bacterium]